MKLDKLRKKHNKPSTGRSTTANSNIKQNWVHNLSNRTLSNPEHQVLGKGFKFAITPHKVPILDLVTGVEFGLRQVRDAAQVMTVRSKVSEILKSAKVPESNLSHEEKMALKQLKNDNSIKILKADKGNSTVVMDSTTYDSKVQNLLLDNSTYLQLPSKPNPLNALVSDTNKFVWQLRISDKISQSEYFTLRCSNGVMPRFYGLPKVHKANVPLRPIVSFVNSPTYNLSKFLCKIISPLLKNTYTVNNSVEFTNLIRDQIVGPNEVFVSFDVVSLFTSVPTDQALDCVLQLLLNDDTLQERTALSISDIKAGLEICFKATIFTYNNTNYRQIFGLPMGSCISPVLSNIFMEHIEQLALSTFHTPPTLWCRYVDDTFCILDSRETENFQSHLNTICSHIQFTKEEEVESSLPFLDVLVSHSNNVISTKIYKKPTHTDRYLQYSSHHPKQQKLAITHTLHHKISSHITDPTEAEKARKDVCLTLHANGYPYKHTYPPKPKPLLDSPTFTGYTSLPYIQGTTEKIRRVLSKIGVKVAMKPVRTIGHIIPSPKDPISPDEINCLVYEIPCNDCDFVYIGQTKRNLNTRLREHQRAIRQQKPENSALCEHVMETDHLIGWSNARILKVETNYFKRLTAESWFIHSHPKVLNRSDGESLPVIYRSLL